MELAADPDAELDGMLDEMIDRERQTEPDAIAKTFISVALLSAP